MFFYFNKSSHISSVPERKNMPRAKKVTPSSFRLAWGQEGVDLASRPIIVPLDFNPPFRHVPLQFLSLRLLQEGESAIPIVVEELVKHNENKAASALAMQLGRLRRRLLEMGQPFVKPNDDLLCQLGVSFATELRKCAGNTEAIDKEKVKNSFEARTAKTDQVEPPMVLPIGEQKKSASEEKEEGIIMDAKINLLLGRLSTFNSDQARELLSLKTPIISASTESKLAAAVKVTSSIPTEAMAYMDTLSNSGLSVLADIIGISIRDLPSIVLASDNQCIATKEFLLQYLLPFRKTPSSISSSLSHIKTGFQKIPALQDLAKYAVASKAIYNIIKEETGIKRNNRQHIDALVIDRPADILRAMEPIMLSPEDYSTGELFILVALASGRRMVEILQCGNFEPIPGKEYWASFSGAAKRCYVESAPIPLLVPFNRLVHALEQLRNKCTADGLSRLEIHHRFKSSMVYACKKWLSPFIVSGSQVGCHAARRIYLNLVFLMLQDQGVQSTLVDCIHRYALHSTDAAIQSYTTVIFKNRLGLAPVGALALEMPTSSGDDDPMYK